MSPIQVIDWLAGIHDHDPPALRPKCGFQMLDTETGQPISVLHHHRVRRLVRQQPSQRGPGPPLWREALPMSELPRLRQIALAANDLAAVAGELQKTFGWEDPFHDPGVGEFGLENSVFAAGDTFVEVVSPVKAGTTAGRYLEKRGGDSGYMAIFQVPDIRAARKRIADAGIRVVWQVDLPDMAGTHLHPKDLPGAIVSIDWADPAESWRWAGPAWTGKAPPHRTGSIRAITVEVQNPSGAAAMWSKALGAEATGDDSVAVVELPEAGQILRFVPIGSGTEGGITEVTLDGPAGVDSRIGGVRFRSGGTESAGQSR